MVLLRDFFYFYLFVIEDCFQYMQWLKFDYYDGYCFYVIYVLNKEIFEMEEVDIF